MFELGTVVAIIILIVYLCGPYNIKHFNNIPICQSIWMFTYSYLSLNLNNIFIDKPWQHLRWETLKYISLQIISISAISWFHFLKIAEVWTYMYFTVIIWKRLNTCWGRVCVGLWNKSRLWCIQNLSFNYVTVTWLNIIFLLFLGIIWILGTMWIGYEYARLWFDLLKPKHHLKFNWRKNVFRVFKRLS